MKTFLNKTLFTLRGKDLIIIFLSGVVTYLGLNLHSVKQRLSLAEKEVRESYCGDVLTSVIIDAWFGK